MAWRLGPGTPDDFPRMVEILADQIPDPPTVEDMVALEYVRSKGAPSIKTHYHPVNAPMLAVNRKLGCVPEPGVFVMTREA